MNIHTNDLKEMAEQQMRTDKEMCKVHNLDMASLEWFNNRIIALTVEFVETMQVTEKFKDWKIKKGKIDLNRFKKVGYDLSGDVYEDILTKDLISKEDALKRTLVEECADALHFALSLINLFEFDAKISIYINVPFEQCIVNCLYELMSVQQSYVLNNCNVDKQVKDHFSLFLNYMFSYFYISGVSIGELYHAYWLKNKVNHQRIKEGY